ncbi:MAG: hypothetical protein DSY91_02135 [Deltaproteobacteria bacterium]|nr:MAG: hypothetical protein DSY91_02135 [Deltaproteobacteria bacterium]
MRKSNLFLALMLIGSFILLGCVSQKENLIRQGASPAYAQGFEDGCHSGKKAGGSWLDQFKKNTHLFNTNPDYKQGWIDGYNECEKQQEAFERQNRNTIEQQRLMEEKRHDKWMEKHYNDKELLKGIDTRGLEKFK